MITVREASLSEVVQVQAEIVELHGGYGIEKYRAELNGVKSLVLVAEMDQSLVGFKVGYEQSEDVFYSWMGGVVASARRSGVALALLEAQEAWAMAQGYKELRVKTWNQHRSMLRFLISQGYLIWQVDPQDDELETRVHFKKRLKEG